MVGNCPGGELSRYMQRHNGSVMRSIRTVVVIRGGSRIFIWGGGGGDATDHKHEARSPLRPGGVQGPLKGPGSSQGF